MDEFEMVRAYSDTIQAELARAHLQANGIDAVVVESAAFNPMLSSALGIELRVPAREKQLARAMLATLDAQIEEDSEADDDADNDAVRCPMCESEYCYYEGPGPEGHYGAHPLVAVARVAALLGPKRWRCRKCKHEWADETAEVVEKTRIAKGIAKPVFRLYRGNPGLGIFCGIGFGLVVSILWPQLGIIVTVLAMIAGWLIGRGIGADVCSEPNCRHVLAPDIEECPGCKGVISGRILEAHEHYRMVADVRRELSAALDEDDVDSQNAHPKRRSKKSLPLPPIPLNHPPRRTIPIVAAALGSAVILGGVYVYISDQSPPKPPVPTMKANAESEPASASKSEVYEGKAAPYRITLANTRHWKRFPASEKYDLAFEHQTNGATIAISIEPMENSFLTTDDIADEGLERIQANTQSFKFKSRKSVDGASSGILTHSTNVRDGKSYELIASFFVQSDSYYVIEASFPTSVLPRMHDEIEAITRSFTLPPEKPGPTTLPKPVLTLAAPVAPPSRYQEFDLTIQKPQVLAVQAAVAHQKKQFDIEVQFWHWAIVRGYMPAMYNLAVAYSALGQTDAAFYWLEKAAAEEGVETSWFDEEVQLQVLRKDPRWATVRPYLQQVTRYWQQVGKQETLLIVPRSYKLGQSITVVVGLHGYGSVPSDFAADYLQKIADANSVAFIGVSGTISLGPHNYRWVESITKDKKRIDEALAEVADRVTVSPNQTILLGFSQGAQMAVAIAARYPDQYAGAIAMSPWTRRQLNLEAAERPAGIEKRHFVIVGGKDEPALNVTTARKNAKWLQSMGAEVFHKEYENQNDSSFPADYEKALPQWIRFILGTGNTPK